MICFESAEVVSGFSSHYGSSCCAFPWLGASPFSILLFLLHLRSLRSTNDPRPPPHRCSSSQNHNGDVMHALCSLLWVCCRSTIVQVPVHLSIININWKIKIKKTAQHANKHKYQRSPLSIQQLPAVSAPTLDQNYLKLTRPTRELSQYWD